MPSLRCPACAIALGDGETHCPRCGLRVAPLPRRPRRAPPVGGEPSPGGLRERLLPDRAAPTRAAVLHGAVAGAAIDAAAVVVGVVAQLAGAGGRAVAGNTLVLVVVGLLLAALALDGIRVRRWGPPEVLRERVAASSRRDPRRTALLTAAAVVAVAFLAAAALR